MRHVRTRMVAGAARLLAERGLQAASFTEVLELTGAPRGSIYHHFPGGKTELVNDALGLAAQRVLDALPMPQVEPGQVGSASAEATTVAFLGHWRKVLAHSDFAIGCAVLGVTVESSPGPTLERAAGIFSAWSARLAELLEGGGVSGQEARRFAVHLVAAAEGAVVLSRAERSLEPFELVSDQLVEQARLLDGRSGSLDGRSGSKG